MHQEHQSVPLKSTSIGFPVLSDRAWAFLKSWFQVEVWAEASTAVNAIANAKANLFFMSNSSCDGSVRPRRRIAGFPH
jgi:hypothetical protein